MIKEALPFKKESGKMVFICAKEEFYKSLEEYKNLWDKGLKKQANRHLKTCIENLCRESDKNSLNDILEDFCFRYFDNGEFSYLNDRGNALLPYELNKILWEFLKSEAVMGKMPHMRRIWEIFKMQANPFDIRYELDTELFLKRAYEHKDCDEKTVNCYLWLELYYLGYGAHHFPDRCLFDKETYLKFLSQAQEIIDTHRVDCKLLQDFDYLAGVYECYLKFDNMGRKGDFLHICKDAGFTF